MPLFISCINFRTKIYKIRPRIFIFINNNLNQIYAISFKLEINSGRYLHAGSEDPIPTH